MRGHYIRLILFTVLFCLGMTLEKPVLEALSLIVLFADGFLIVIKNRCPGCHRMLPVHPPVWAEEEFCQFCGTKIE